MVVMAILAVIVGLVVPNVTAITKKANATSIAGQHEKMREAVYQYYHDVNEWPTEWSGSDLSTEKYHQLWTNKDDGDTGMVGGWSGPYIDRPLLQDERWNGDWGVIEDFDLNGFSDDKFTCLVYTNVPQEVCRQVDQLMDDGTGTDDTGQDSGVVQYDVEATIDANTLNNDWDTPPGGAWDVDDDNVLVIAIFK